MGDTGFWMETALASSAPNLHCRYTRCLGHADRLLTQYHDNFPDYTDHSLLHAVEVTNLCNQLTAPCAEMLCADELYVLLMGALLHDVGMGIRPELFRRYYNKLSGQFAPSGEKAIEAIRAMHHEFSALFILEHWRGFYIPNFSYAAAIASTARGHRKVELADYDKQYAIKNGGTVNLPYLAAVVRLADELDVSAARNLSLQYAGFVPSNNRSALEFQKHRSVTSAQLEGTAFVISAATDDRQEYNELQALCAKMCETLEYCRQIARKYAGAELPVETICNDIRFTGLENNGLLIEIERAADALTLRLCGWLDAATSPRLEERIGSVLNQEVKKLVFDFAQVDYISSAGLRVILSAQKKMLEQSGEMSVQNVCDTVMRIFQMTGFCSIIDVLPA